MPAELHAPNLPEVPISLGAARGETAPGPRAPRLPWHLRLRDGVATYLPLLLMAALALASWWLARQTPSPAAERPTAAVRTEPDYTMRRFVVQRFGADGALALQLEGRELRHYAAVPGQPERIEVDQVDLRAWAADGRVTTAMARRAVASGDGRQIRLQGGAEVRGLDDGGVPVELKSDFLELLLDEGLVRTDQPVQVLHGAQRLSAGGLVYERERRLLRFDGPVRAVLPGPRR